MILWKAIKPSYYERETIIMAVPIGAAVVAGALGGFTKTMTGKALAKICYLFMLADGQCSDTEKKFVYAGVQKSV